MRLLPLQVPESSLGVGGFHQIPIEGGTPDRSELLETDCDLDTLKKLKLGMRSSLWSRPTSNSNNGQQAQNPSGHPSDYSIAV